MNNQNTLTELKDDADGATCVQARVPVRLMRSPRRQRP
jgi:hypothetical protein